ncbi:nucleoside phosphorylase [Mucilaginibacter arboris]|uniref:Uridine phosphorylase n=1 Tax=Mucilaginibacter arboris TaxID=2682090 RepID=A0A7K1SXU7_9SPHI|nr:nucleoside phosphorylase [Mucilaginibacter arboris]MVN22145.1 phosphorylase [Mucilaginibacter arboris]
MQPIPETDLILNPDNSIYHLNLLPEDIAETIITVGDPDRVGEVSKYFDRIDLKKGKREFITHAGWIGNKRVTVISTGIGTDNIDIVLNELDALVNIDFETRLIKEKLTSLNIIRIGTSGSLHADIPMDSILVSDYALGFDALMNYYTHHPDPIEQELKTIVGTHFSAIKTVSPYLTAGSKALIAKIGYGLPHGITATAPGFYAPQGRQVRAKNAIPDFLNLLQTFEYQDQRITNLEMETAGIYALAKVLGHEALSVNAILASRAALKFSKNPQKTVDAAIQLVLERL